jgi:hypothetical protein
MGSETLTSAHKTSCGSSAFSKVEGQQGVAMQVYNLSAVGSISKVEELVVDRDWPAFWEFLARLWAWPVFSGPRPFLGLDLGFAGP